MPPCFSSPACARLETTNNDSAAAAHACTLRMLPSLEIPASARPDFSNDIMAEGLRNQRQPVAALVLWTKAARRGGGTDDRAGDQQGRGARPRERSRLQLAASLRLRDHGPCWGPRSRSSTGEGSNAAAQAALPFCCFMKASARFCNSCGARSSLWVAMNQLLPDGSFTAPLRSP